jgi:hypothetical protein
MLNLLFFKIQYTLNSKAINVGILYQIRTLCLIFFIFTSLLYYLWIEGWRLFIDYLTVLMKLEIQKNVPLLCKAALKIGLVYGEVMYLIK